MNDLPGSLSFNEILDNIHKVFSGIAWQEWGAAVICVIGGVIVAGFASTLAGRILSKHTSLHYTQIIKRILYYSIIVISLLIAISTLQLNMQVLGIATLITVAIGFAAQTAVSNIISGLFLVFERPFSIGDELELNGIRGILLSIDLLSIKLQTPNNTLIRIPNENLIKSQFNNLTKFPIRRLDIPLFIDWDNDMEKVRETLIDVAKKNQMILESPQPQLMFEKFSEHAINLVFAVWVKTESFNTLKNSFPYQIQQALLQNKFKMPLVNLVLVKDQL